MASQHLSITRGILYSLWAGAVLGLSLKLAQALSGAKVYKLLLNVDFMPVIDRPLPEWFEFMLHLIVAAVLGIVYVYLLRRWRHPLLWGLALGITAIPLYVPLSLLSARVPRLDDGAAWLWWTIGHLLFGLTLGLLGSRRSSPLQP